MRKRRFLKTLTALLAVLLISNGLALAKKGGGGKPNPPPTPDLPAVRYRIEVAQQIPGDVSANDMNNLGVVVGYTRSDLGTSAFIFYPGSGEAIDLNTLVVDGIPDGAWLRSGVAINDWMVVVGSMEYDTGETAGFALDLGAETPVVDLLPNSGSGRSYGRRINENGDILGLDDGSGYYLFNPGLYDGNPVVRAVRNGLPQDLTLATTEPLPDSVRHRASHPDLNNPQPGRPAQIVGSSPERVYFRYTTGATPALESFPELNANIAVFLNDSGTFAGQVWGAKVKGQTQIDPFRYDQAIELLPPASRWERIEFVQDINSSGDLITTEHVYQDDWGWVGIDDLVIGTDADLATWFSSSVELYQMNDRGGTADAPQLVAKTYGSGNNTMFILTPEPATE